MECIGIRAILGLYCDKGKQNENYCLGLGFRVRGIGFRV